TDAQHAAGSQIDDEHRVVGDQASPRPDRRREEIGTSNGAPVRLKKRLPRGRALWYWRQPRRLQDPPNRRAAHAMTHVLERALDSRVTPGRILGRHPHDELADL